MRLLRFHDEMECFLQGLAFQPEALCCCIRVYNQVHRDKPPPENEPGEYKLGAKSAVHNNKTGTKIRIRSRSGLQCRG